MKLEQVLDAVDLLVAELETARAQLAALEAAELRRREDAADAAEDRAAWQVEAERGRVVLRQLWEAVGVAPDVQGLTMGLVEAAHALRRERDALVARVVGAELREDALRRERDHLQAELRASVADAAALHAELAQTRETLSRAADQLALTTGGRA